MLEELEFVPKSVSRADVAEAFKAALQVWGGHDKAIQGVGVCPEEELEFVPKSMSRAHMIETFEAALRA